MVDIREIYARASESTTIRQIAQKFMSLKSAQAVTVRILPWLLFDPDAYHYLRHFPFPWDGREWSRLPPFFFDRWLSPEDHVAAFPAGRQRITMADIDRRFHDFPPFPGYGPIYKYPFQVTLHADLSKLSESESEVIGQMTRDENVLVTAERRPPARLQLSAGDQVLSGGTRGTLGGFIRDGADIYAVTCGHVAKSTSITDLTGNSVGNTTVITAPQAMLPGTVCTPFPAPPAIGAHVNSGDFALISTTAPVSPSGLNSSVSLTLNQSDLIDVLCGGSSRRFAVRSLCIAMAIADSGTDYCFAPLVELYSGSGTTRSGDSGAWGVKNGTDWATTIVGADSISSFAFDARDVASWIDASGVVTGGGWTVH
jgi:hypothetical protein